MYERVCPYCQCPYVCQKKQNKRVSDSISSLKFFKETSILNKLFKSFCLFSAKSREHKKKWSVVSVSEPQSHIGLGASFKLRRNLCSFRRLNFNRSLDNKLTPTESSLAKRVLCFKLKKSLIIDLRCLILSASLSELCSLYHSLIQKGKNECLKCSVLAPNLLILFWSGPLVL